MKGSGTLGLCATEGAFEYSSGDSNYRFCDASDWIPLASSGTLGGCSGMPAVEYDTGSNVLKWCDVNTWRAIGADPGDGYKMTAIRSAMGASLTGGTKWNGGALGPDGKIYGMPYTATDILIIDPGAGTATRSALGADLTGTNKWNGGVLGPDGKIYGMPYTATDILIIDPGAETATRSALGASLTGSAKWNGGVLGPDGKIYGMPYDATDILIIDPGAGTATRSALGADLTGSAKWRSGVLGPDGKIYGMPSSATDILIIDPGAGTATRSALGADLTGSAKWNGGALGPDGKIYGMPYTATDILIIDPGAGTAARSALGADLTGLTKWSGAVLGPGGKTYGMPYTATDIPILGPTDCIKPYPFSFASVPLAQPNTQYTTVITQINGIGDGLTPAISISGQGGREFQICNDSGCSSIAVDWGSAPQTISDGQYVRLRLTSSPNWNEMYTATLTIDVESADWNVTTVPPPKTVFVTSTTYTGNGFGAVAGAHTQCQNRATAASLTGTYKAWISSNAGNDPGSTFTQHTGNYWLVGGTKIANNWTDLTDGTLAAAINKTESGGTAPAQTWTNVFAAGGNVFTDIDCSNWTSGTGSTTGYVGTTTATNGDWSFNTTEAPCNQSKALYCFEQ